LSLVLLALGRISGDVSENTVGIAAFAFAFLAVGSTYAILQNDRLLRWAIPGLDKLGLHDLHRGAPADEPGGKPARICLLGFSWTASSLLEDISRERSDLLPDVVVVDFNPIVHEKLHRRGVRAVYGDITQRDVLHHAGVAGCEIIICSLPNMVLKGADNLKMLRQLRELNPAAKIIVHAELLANIPMLYAAGAGFVTAPRLLEAADLLRAIEAAEKNLLDEKRGEQLKQLEDRNEVIP
jgi:Trk K+ transport system NAD-binding subunit